MSEIRNIVLTGDVADSFGKRGKRRSRKVGNRVDNTVVNATESPDLKPPQDQYIQFHQLVFLINKLI